MKKILILLLFIPLIANGQLGRYPFYTPTVQAAAPSGPPDFLSSDGDTEAWYIADEGLTLVDNVVSQWDDYLGGGKNLVQATAEYRPTPSGDTLIFDGTNDMLRQNTFVMSQPISLYIVVKNVTFTDDDRMFEWADDPAWYLMQNNYAGSGGGLKMFNGATTTDLGISEFASGVWHIIRIVINNTASKLQTDENDAHTFTHATQDMEFFKVGMSEANIAVAEIIVRSVDDDETNETAIYDYLADKYGL